MSTTSETTTPRSTDSAAVVAGLKQALDRGELVPNQRLIEADICDEYHASRGTVRAALAELTLEGLVERVQNRGARVRAVPVQEAIEITEARAALEAVCAAKAAEHITDDDACELQALGEAMRRAVDTGDLLAYADCNKTLHRRLVEMSRHDTAAALIVRLRGQSVRFQFRLALQPGRPAVSLPEHLEIVDAVCAGDPERAATAMTRHLTSVANAIRRAAEDTGA